MMSWCYHYLSVINLWQQYISDKLPFINKTLIVETGSSDACTNYHHKRNLSAIQMELNDVG